MSVQNGSTTVTGAGVDFAASSRVGDSFVGPDGATYEVANVASATVISILPAYKGATVSGAAYAIMPVQGYDKMLSDAFNSLNNQFGPKLAALGTTGNYDVLPVSKGGTGVADGKPKFTSISLSGISSGISSAPGAYIGWNGREASGFSGDFNFLCNKGSGTGGFTWRSVNAENTVTGPVMSYSYSGNLTVPGTVTQGSDRRLKINDVEISGGLEKILQIRPVEFDRRSMLTDKEYPFHEAGVIAQELHDVLPFLVTPGGVGDDEEIWRVNYTGIIPYLISAIKELKAEIEELKANKVDAA
ncbi:tail fiber domain-containing protein [Pseudomonas veronii]|uniref:tail fiber domain-containing protein n=1 Tax=Pseudomonas veronii TaxID=76761 RepID=UPI0030B944DD